MRKRLKKFLPDSQTIDGNRYLRPFRSTLLHPRLWHLNRHSAAGAVAAGLFCGLIPGPLQMPGAALCALIFHLNLPLALAVTLYTNPLTIVPLYLLAFQIGSSLLDSSLPWQTPPIGLGLNSAERAQEWLQWLADAGKPLALGLLTLASTLAIVGYSLTRTAWRMLVLHRWRQRRKRVAALKS